MSRPFYLTTAIYYANGAPHIGHAYEVIAADVIARFNRLIGKQVFFLTGTDEHGIKVQKTALAQGTSPKTYVDDIAAVYRQEWAYLNVTHDRFIRTTDPEHYELVTRLWNKLVEKGDIYKAQYTGTYCPIREAFLTDRELKLMQDTGEDMSKLEAVTEENYFFRLSNYKDRVREFIETHETFILPAYRRNEVLNQLEDLADVRVRQLNGDLGFIDEHIDELLIFGDLGQHPLDGKQPLEALDPVRDRLVDLGHAADGHPLEEVVVAEFERFAQPAILESTHAAAGPGAGAGSR